MDRCSYYYQRPLFASFDKYFTNDSFINQRKRLLLFRKYNVPKLKDALELCQNKEIILDLKFQHNADSFIKELLSVLQEYDTCHIILQSSDIASLNILKECSHYTWMAIIDSYKDFDYFDDYDYFNIKKDLIDYQSIDNLLKDGKFVAVWTVNSSSELDSVTSCLKEHYTDVVYVTDFPDYVLKNLEEKIKN